MKIANDVTQLVGNTPLVKLNRIAEGSAAVIAAKVIWKLTNTYSGMATPSLKVAAVVSGVTPARNALPSPATKGLRLSGASGPNAML